jgi:hypothetical protein
VTTKKDRRVYTEIVAVDAVRGDWWLSLDTGVDES